MDAFRAGGDLTEEKKASLAELAKIFNIPVERHKTEIRRAINDELLNTISYRYFHVNLYLDINISIVMIITTQQPPPRNHLTIETCLHSTLNTIESK